MDTNNKWIEWVNESGDKFGVHIDDFQDVASSSPTVWRWVKQEGTYRVFRKMTVTERELARQLFVERGVLA